MHVLLSLCLACTVVLHACVEQIAVQDEGDDSPQTLSGDLVALGAAACYGLYTTTIRLQVSGQGSVVRGQGSV